MASPDTFARPVNQELRLNDEMRLNDTRLPHNSPRHSSRGFTAVSTSPQHLVPRSPNESVLSHAPTFPSHSAGRESSGHRATKPRWETHMDKMGWCWDTQVSNNDFSERGAGVAGHGGKDGQRGRLGGARVRDRELLQWKSAPSSSTDGLWMDSCLSRCRSRLWDTSVHTPASCCGLPLALHVSVWVLTQMSRTC